MAQTLSKTNIVNGQTVQAWNVTQSVDAFTGAEAYDITLSGSFTFSGATTGSGYFQSAVVANTIKPQNIVSNKGYTIPYLASTGSTSALYYSATGPTYNPTTNIFDTTSSYAVSSSNAVSASYASNANNSSVTSVIYPSIGPSLPANLKFIAGAGTTGVGSTIAININEITFNILGTNCFITATTSGSSASSISVQSKASATVTFISQNASTDFFYQIMYV
jgi:hypothetical protein